MLPHREPTEGPEFEFQKILDTDIKHRPCLVHMDNDTKEICTLAEQQFEISALEPDYVAELNNALHICPTWKVAKTISYDYLQNNLTEPIANLRAKMGTNKEGGKNCCPKRNILPVIAAICVGAIEMLLNNKLVEENLHNRSVGVVCDICYKPGETMGTKGAQLYVVVEFHKSNLFKPLLDGQTNTKLIPIPICRQQYNKQCC